MEEIFTVNDRLFRDPKQIVYTDHEFTIVRHPNPIAKFHFISGLTTSSSLPLMHLNKLHIPLLTKMRWITRIMVKRAVGATDNVRLHYGFPADIAYQRLHMHVFSDDLKNAKSAVHN